MSVIDLKKRITNDHDLFNACKKSDESYIWVNTSYKIHESEPVTIELAVGDKWFDPDLSHELAIPGEGLAIPPGKSVVVLTKEEIETPLNVFGILTGKGRFIFEGLSVASGKVDPGYKGQLRVLVLNSRSRPMVLKKEDVVCSLCFFAMESHLLGEPRRYESGQPVPSMPVLMRRRLKSFTIANWDKILTLIVAATALAVSIFAAIHKDPPDVQKSVATDIHDPVPAQPPTGKK